MEDCVKFCLPFYVRNFFEIDLVVLNCDAIKCCNYLYTDYINSALLLLSLWIIFQIQKRIPDIFICC